MRRALSIGLGIIVLLTMVGLWQGDRIGFALFRWYVTPDERFDADAAPPPHDYREPLAWAALPHRQDGADAVPPGATDRQRSAGVDVFFVHPTTYLSSASWNAPLDDPAAGDFVDRFVLPGQASAFNGCCAVHAPRYRQATIAAFFADGEDAGPALDLAFTDVLAAFEHFLETFNRGRPFVVAGHSQGAFHVERLLRERITGTELVHRLVAAYPIGYFFDESRYRASVPDVPPCSGPGEARCMATWNTVGPAFEPFDSPAGSVCVNPLTWSDRAGRHEDNPGSLGPSDGMQLEAGVADARCEGGLLRVSSLRSTMYDEPPIYLGKDNHHLLDIGLYWLALRRNIAAQAAQWASRNGPPSPGP